MPFHRLQFPRYGFFARTLARTRNNIFGKVQTLLGQADITEDTWDELEVLLLQADVGAETTDRLLARLKQRAADEAIVQADKLRAALKQELEVVDAGGDRNFATTKTACWK